MENQTQNNEELAITPEEAKQHHIEVNAPHYKYFNMSFGVMILINIVITDREESIAFDKFYADGEAGYITAGIPCPATIIKDLTTNCSSAYMRNVVVDVDRMVFADFVRALSTVDTMPTTKYEIDIQFDNGVGHVRPSMISIARGELPDDDFKILLAKYVAAYQPDCNFDDIRCIEICSPAVRFAVPANK